MKASEVRLELAVGRRVRAMNGRVIGRLEEIRVSDSWTIDEYLIGPLALAERLSITAISIRGGSMRRGYRARWNQLDISDPVTPRLTCSIEELARLD